MQLGVLKDVSQCRLPSGRTLLVWTYVHPTEEKPTGRWDLQLTGGNSQ